MSASETTPPPLQPQSQVPTAKERKYDRQLRLWAASGQQALENARILLLNTGPGVAGVEILKNLILPGVGSFTIIDEAVVGEEDLGVNFFLEEDSLGKSRAEESARLLKELNPEVEGRGIKTTVASCINEDGLKSHTLVLLIGPSPHVQAVATYCRNTGTPLFYIHSIGFFSHFSIQVPPLFPIVDTHPDPASTQDLRLLTPWPNLVDYVKQKTDKIEGLSDHEHGHIPYLLLLLYYLERWKETHDGKPPQDYGEKKEFKALVESGARTKNAEGGEENYDEAAAAVLKSLNPPSISSGLREVFETEECKTPSADVADFWIAAHAIQAFHNKHSVLPLPGALPDMKAQSADYIQLQNIYKSKARQDLAEVTSIVRSKEHELGRKHQTDKKEIEAFCKGAAFVKLIRGQPLRFAQLPALLHGKDAKAAAREMDWSGVAKGLSLELQMQEESLLPIYLAFLAYDACQLQRAPQEKKNASNLAEEASASADAFLNSLAAAADSLEGGADLTVLREKVKDVLAEVERAEGAAELHNISALTGGVVAQEVIKVITKQYVPVDNACVFDGVVSKSAVFRM